MATVTIVLTDQNDEDGGTVNIRLEADPPLTDDSGSAAQAMAVHMMSTIKELYTEETK